ncbi:MAG: Uma2 family endonuclease [Desulfobacterales bacterium]|nr:Uma2 family endonuclease [Desulfobacterales bacterium]
MSEIAEKMNISEKAYLEMERVSEEKHEYFQNEIFSMAGGSYKHSTIISNIVSELRNQLRKKTCRALSSDMKVRMGKNDKYFYPDVIVVCGAAKFFDDKQDIITNPIVIIEVLSDSTEAYDRGDKFAYYRTIDSLREYALVSQKSKKIEKFFKEDKGYWRFNYTDESKQEIIFESIECKLNLDDIYEKVFEE